MKVIYFVFLVLFFSSNVSAVGSIVGKVTSIGVDYPNNRAKIYFDNEVSASGGNCRSSSNKNVMGVEMQTETGKFILAMALTAYASNSNVEARSDGTCTVYPNEAETLYYFRVM